MGLATRLQKTKASVSRKSFNLNNIALLLSFLFCFIFLIVIISYYALPPVLKTTSTSLAVKFNRNFVSELNLYMADLNRKKANASLQNLLQYTIPGGSGAKSVTNRYSELPGDFSKVVFRSGNALIADPFNGQHYRLLGQLHELAGNKTVAYNLMKEASEISAREMIAHELIFRTNIIDNHPLTALLYADRLFSFAPEAMPYYASAFGVIIKNDNSREELARLLMRNPNWRRGFFSQIVPKFAVDQTGAISALFSTLKKSPAPPTNYELNFFLSNLISAGKYHLAYQNWVTLRPSEHLNNPELINNGGFEEDPTGLPFDWTIAGGKEVRAQINTIAGPKVSRVLNVEFGNGRITFPNISQLMILTPGNYRIQGKYTGETTGKRGLFWTVSCYGGNKIGTSDEIRGKIIHWRAFEFDIEVPEENCLAQRIFLKHDARSQSEQILSGSISFDDIKVSPIKND